MTTSSVDTTSCAAEASTSVFEAYTRHGLALKRFIGRFMRNFSDVEDIAQEAFLRAYAVERLRSIEQPKSLLFRIAKQLALSQLSRKSRQMTEYMSDVEDSAATTVEGGATESSAEEEV